MKTYETITGPKEASSSAKVSLPADCYWSDGYTREVAVKVTAPDSQTLQLTADVDEQAKMAPTDGSWKAIRNSNIVKMTDMYHGRVSVKNHIGSIPHHLVAADHGMGTSWAVMRDNICHNDTRGPYVSHSYTGPVVAQLEYSENGDINYWAERLNLTPPPVQPDAAEPNRVKSLKAAAYQELFQGYNLGEELWEVRESLKTIAQLMQSAIKPVETIRDALRSSANSGATAWMTYRYGVMPIIYSIQDVMKLIDTKSNVLTVRRRHSENPKLVGPTTQDCFWEEGATSVVWNVTAKGIWATESLARFDRVNLNPITTAMTVYRFAWVVRWFINLNSWIDSQLKALTTLASSYDACVSTKTFISKTTYLRYYHKTADFHVGPLSDAGLNQPSYPGFTIANKHPMGTFVDVPLRTVEVETYNRYTYKPNETEIVWDPYLDWKRGLDAVSLLLPGIQRAFRRLHV